MRLVRRARLMDALSRSSNIRMAELIQAAREAQEELAARQSTHDQQSEALAAVDSILVGRLSGGEPLDLPNWANAQRFRQSCEADLVIARSALDEAQATLEQHQLAVGREREYQSKLADLQQALRVSQRRHHEELQSKQGDDLWIARLATRRA